MSRVGRRSRRWTGCLKAHVTNLVEDSWYKRQRCFYRGWLIAWLFRCSLLGFLLSTILWLHALCWWGRPVAPSSLGRPSESTDRIATWLVIHIEASLVHTSPQGFVERLGVDWGYSIEHAFTRPHADQLILHTACAWLPWPAGTRCRTRPSGSGRSLAWTFPQWPCEERRPSSASRAGCS